MVIYQKCNKQVEKWSASLQFALLKVTINCIMWPKMIMSYFNYFTTDLGAEAFELPTYEWQAPNSIFNIQFKNDNEWNEYILNLVFLLKVSI